MRTFSKHFYIDGKPLLVPDEEVKTAYQDLDDASSGRDESGYMHRLVARYKVGTWEFSYAFLTDEEKRYMEGLFPDAPTFLFTHPSRVDTQVPEHTVCYRSNYTITWKNARTGLWSGYGFTVIAC